MDIIHFGNPQFLPYTLIAVLVAVPSCIIWLRRRSAIKQFFGVNQGHIHPPKRILFFLILFCFIIIGTALILSEPYLVTKKEQDVFEPLLIVMAQDISKSMLAPVASDSSKEVLGKREGLACIPTRLQTGKNEVMQFIKVLEQQQTDKAALVIFARYAYPAIPVPTQDYLLFKRRFQKETLLENVLTMAEGSNHWAGVDRALQVFDPGSPLHKLVIVLTDGDPEAPADVLEQSKKEALEKLKQTKDVRIYIVGIGEQKTPLPIPLTWLKNSCPDPEGGFVKETTGPEEGSILFTRTDPKRLQAFANDLGGTYLHTDQGSDLTDILKSIVKRERVKTGVKYETSLIDLNKPLLCMLLGLLGVMATIKTP